MMILCDTEIRTYVLLKKGQTAVARKIKWDFRDFPVGLPNLRGRKFGTSWVWKLMEALDSWVMAFCKFGHVSLVSKISKKLLKLEPWNLMNRPVVMSRWSDYASNFEWNWWGILFCLRSSVCPFITLFCACHILRTLHARVLEFYIWVPHEKAADPYFFSCSAYLFFSSPEQKLRVSYCDHPLSVVRRPLSTIHSFDPILMKLAQNVCPYEI